MLSHLRLIPLFRATSKCTHLHHRARFITTSLPRCGELGPQPPSENEESEIAAEVKQLEEEDALRHAAKEKTEQEGEENDSRDDAEELDLMKVRGDFTAASWLAMHGLKFKEHRPRNFLGRKRPFPGNPDFKPPPPLSNAIRQDIFKEYMKDPKANSVRVLSRRYHLSISRIEAILRLKSLENDWIKGKELQTGFEYGMEYLLGVKQAMAASDFNQKRYDFNEADIAHDDPETEKMRLKYRRMYWESTTEDNKDLVLPKAVEDAEKSGAKYNFDNISDLVYRNYTLVPRVPELPYMKKPESRIVVRETPGRTTLQFVDVGAKFMDVEGRVKRIKSARLRAKKHGKAIA